MPNNHDRLWPFHSKISFVFLVLLLLTVHSYSEIPGTIAIVDVNIIPMTSDEILKHQTLIIQDHVITEIGPNQNVEVPAAARQISGNGCYLIPGLTDAHVHLFSTTEIPLYLANGVTTVFNLNGRPQHLLWRKWIQQHKISGPTIFSAGPLFDSHRTPEEAVRMVDDQAAAGYDAIKIYNGVGREEYSPLIAEAKKKNLLLMGHISREAGFEATLQAGQSIAHAEEFTYTYFNTTGADDFSGIVFDESKIPVVARMTARSGVYVIPTLAMFRDIITQATALNDYLKNPEMNYLAPWLREGLQPGKNVYSNRYSPQDLKQLELSLPFQRKLVRALEAEGVPLMTGTDSTSIGPIAGFSIHEELLELVNSGLTPLQALQSATIVPAKYLRRSKDYGTIEVGKRADFVLLTANPLDDIKNTRDIIGLMTDGEWFDSNALQSMLQKIPAAYDRQIKFVSKQFNSNPVEAGKYLDEQDPWGFIGATALRQSAMASSPAQFHHLLQSIVQQIPDSGVASEEVVNWVGKCLLRENRSREAMEAFRENAARFPQSTRALDALANAYAKTGNRVKAAEFYNKALAIDSKYPNADAAKKFVSEQTAKN